MVAYSFQRRFVGPILANRKRHTIRAPRRGRSRHAGVGDPVTLITGSRFKPEVVARSCCELRAAVALDFRVGTPDAMRVLLTELAGNARLAERLREEALDPEGFAVSDGFTSLDDMAMFWTNVHQTTFFPHGELIRWEAL